MLQYSTDVLSFLAVPTAQQRRPKLTLSRRGYSILPCTALLLNRASIYLEPIGALTDPLRHGPLLAVWAVQVAHGLDGMNENLLLSSRRGSDPPLKKRKRLYSRLARTSVPTRNATIRFLSTFGVGTAKENNY